MFKNLLVASTKVRSVLITCKRKSQNGMLPKKILPYGEFVRFSDYRLVLKNNLGIKSADAISMLLKERQMLKLPQEYLARQCKLFLKWNCDLKSLLEEPSLLLVSESTLENLTMLLRDMGAPMDRPLPLKSFSKAMHLKMYVFKGYVRIPCDAVVAKNFLKCIKEPKEGVEPLTIPDDSLTAYDYHMHCLRWYIKWKLNISEENEEEMKKILIALKFRSFTIMEQVFEICHKEIGMSVEQIKKHRCLVHASPSDLRRIIDEQQAFYGKKIKKLLKLHPMLCRMEYENVVEVMKLLEKNDVTELAIFRYPQLLLENAFNLEFRLQTMDACPETKILKNNIKSIHLILGSFKQSQLRLRYLRHLNIKFATVRLLSAASTDFKKYLTHGTNRTKSAEIAYSLTKLLNIEADVLMAQLRRHPYWNHIDLLSMHDTANFLKEQGFKNEDITDNIPIVLYPREKIRQGLEKLNQKRSLSHELGKTWSGTLTLALCLYEIEREFHFSNDGVWREESLVPRHSTKRDETSADNIDSSDEIGAKEETSETS